MSISNKLATLGAITALVSVPTLADGINGKTINRGPAPLSVQSPHALIPPEPGCVLVDGHQWSCPVPNAHFVPAPHSVKVYKAPKTTRQQHQTTPHYGHHAQDHHRQSHMHTHAHSHYPAAQRATTRRVVSRTQSGVRTQSGLILTDIEAFTGGVGNGVDGGFHVSGGSFIIGRGGRSFVLGHSASRFIFNNCSGGQTHCGKRRGDGHK